MINGAKTFSIMTFIIRTLIIKGLYVTLSISDSQLGGHSISERSAVILSVVFLLL